MTEIIYTEHTPEELAEFAAYNSPQAVYEREVAEIEKLRYAAYSDPETGSDVMLIKAQLGEDGITLDDVKARKAAIRAEYPMPEAPKAK